MKASLSDGLSRQAIGVLVAIAFVSALAGGALALALAIATHQDKPFLWAGITAAAVFFVGWLLSLSWWSSILKAILNIDQPIETTSTYASEPAFKVQVDHGGDPNYLWMDNLEIPGNTDTIIRMARMVASGTDFTLAALGGRHKVMTRDEFVAVRDYLASHGYGYKANSGTNSTTLLNAAGRSLMRRIAERPLSEDAPSPTAHGYSPSLRIHSTNTDVHTGTQKGHKARRA